MTKEAERYIEIVNDVFVLKFNKTELEVEKVDKTVDVSNWSFSIEELKNISGLDLMKFADYLYADDGKNL